MVKMVLRMLAVACGTVLWANAGISAQEKPPIRVAIVALVHGHAHGLLRMMPSITSAKLVAIYEPQKELVDQYVKQYHLGAVPAYNDLEKMLSEQKPDAVLIYTTIADHRKFIEAAAKHGISSMVEKPLATTVEDAVAIRKVAREHHVHVLVNYFTTWQASWRQMYDEAA